MSEQHHTTEDLTRYLLGEMAEADQTQLEAHYFADPEKFAELCAWRDGLIDRYMGNQLSPALRLRFEAAIENAWAMNERIRFVETLQEAIDARHNGTGPPIGLSQRFRAFLTRNRFSLFAAAIVTVLAVLALLIISRF